MRIEEQISSLLNLGDSERIISIHKTKVHLFSFSGYPEGKAGFLVLTNERLLFCKKVEQNYSIQMELNLSDPISMVVGGSFYRYIIINNIKYFPTDEKPKTFERLIRDTKQALHSEMKKRTYQTPQKPIRIVESPKNFNHLGICKECGFQNGMDVLFCSQCGAEINQE